MLVSCLAYSLTMKVTFSSETKGDFQETTRSYIPETEFFITTGVPQILYEIQWMPNNFWQISTLLYLSNNAGFLLDIKKGSFQMCVPWDSCFIYRTSKSVKQLGMLQQQFVFMTGGVIVSLKFLLQLLYTVTFYPYTPWTKYNHYYNQQFFYFNPLHATYWLDQLGELDLKPPQLKRLTPW
jgi:hypothetical protein